MGLSQTPGIQTLVLAQQDLETPLAIQEAGRSQSSVSECDGILVEEARLKVVECAVQVAVGLQ